MMKMLLILILSSTCALLSATAETLPGDDPRSEWHCAYPFTETNCQSVIFAWSKDKQVPYEYLFGGIDCSKCVSEYYVDQMGIRHLLYAKCINRFGARLTEQNFVQPIPRYKESMGSSTGWNIVDWKFDDCFETWQCGDYCSLGTTPPTCLKYHTTRWGIYVPVLIGVCSYGTGVTESPDGEPTSTESSTNEPTHTERDSTWYPVY